MVNLRDLAAQKSPSVTFLHPSPIGKDNRGLDLPLGDRPVCPEEAILVAARDDRESVPSIERDGPRRSSPGADQNGFARVALYMPQEARPHALPLRAWRDVGVAYQSDLSLVLNSHDCQQTPVFLRHPEDDAIRNLLLQFVRRHIRFPPPVGRYHPSIGLRSVVDNRQHRRRIRFHAFSNWHDLEAYAHAGHRCSKRRTTQRARSERRGRGTHSRARKTSMWLFQSPHEIDETPVRVAFIVFSRRLPPATGHGCDRGKVEQLV